MKQRIALLLALLLAMTLPGCASTPPETTPTTNPSAPTVPETTVPETLPTETTQPQAPAGFVSLNEIIRGTEITLSLEDHTILLTESGLTVTMVSNSRNVYRNGYVNAVMKARPVIRGDQVYIHEDFYLDYLCKEGSDAVSLFYGVFFFPEEIIDLLDNPDGSVFQRKLAAEVLLPTSMDIEIPHVDMNRVFQYRPLTDYPPVLAEELAMLGYSDPDKYTYTEYALLSGAQTLKQAGFTAGITGDIPFDPNMTVWEYHQLVSEKTHEDYLSLIPPEQEAFARARNLTSPDMWHLQRVFDTENWGDFMAETDETLRATLVEYYEGDNAYIRSIAQAHSGT